MITKRAKIAFYDFVNIEPGCFISAKPHFCKSALKSYTQRGLYFIGEVVDVTGHLGGFNFQWAWSSGVAAGQNA